MQVEFEMDEEYMQSFMPIRTQGQDVWINPELIASFDVAKTDQPLKYKKILEGANAATNDKVSK